MRGRGISLPEILMALAIFALISLIVLLVFGGGLRHLLGTQSSSIALHLAQEKLEELLAKPQSDLASTAGAFTGRFADYRWKVTAKALSNGVMRVSVTVSGSVAESATLTAFHRAAPGVIVYAQPVPGGHEAIFRCNPDGTGVGQLTNGAARDTQPALSPDGKHVAFSSNRDGMGQIYCLDLATHQVASLASAPLGAQCPSWSPDGAMLAYVANDQGYSQIFTTPVTGGGATNISRIDHHETGVCW
ncbi:MAG: prepilin-type N-terminal cleavage/methylation domain-containing protein, partial [Candidatus Xenobia bacterium]